MQDINKLAEYTNIAWYNIHLSDLIVVSFVSYPYLNLGKTMLSEEALAIRRLLGYICYQQE